MVTTEVVENEQSMMRALVLNLICDKGTDLIFPDRGTELGTIGLRNLISDLVSAGATAKFAALDTLFFMRGQSLVDSADQPQEIVLRPSELSGDSLAMKVSCLTTDGRQLSYPNT